MMITLSYILLSRPLLYSMNGVTIFVRKCNKNREEDMHTRKHKTIEALTVALSLTVVAAYAEAATVSYSGTTGVAGANSSLQLQQFDSSLGTLTGIDIEWDSGFSGTFRVFQDTLAGTASAEDLFVSGSIFATATPAGAGGPSLDSTAGNAFSVNVPPTYNQVFAGGQVDSQSFGPLASFIGLGTVNYDFFGTASATSTVSNGLFSGIVDYRYLVNADITYTYDVAAVPVPAAVWLFGSGLLGLVGVARRKKA